MSLLAISRSASEPRTVAHPQQALPRRAALVQRRPAVVGADRRLELPLSQPGPDALRLNDLPDAERDSVHVRVDSPPGQRGGQLPRRLAAAAVHANALAECPKAGAIGHNDVVAGLVASLLDLPDARDDTQAGQQVRDAGGEFTAGAGVVRPCPPTSRSPARHEPSVAHR